jgi:hypothetical protein
VLHATCMRPHVRAVLSSCRCSEVSSYRATYQNHGAGEFSLISLVIIIDRYSSEEHVLICAFAMYTLTAAQSSTDPQFHFTCVDCAWST